MIDEYINNFLSYLEFEKRYSRHTCCAYLADIHQFVEDCGVVDLINTDKKTIRNWVVVLMRKKHKSTTVHRKISSLRSFFHFLVRAGQLEKNPADSVVVPKVASRLPKYCDEKELEDLFDNYEFDEDKEGLRNKLILQMFYFTGMRRDELINLKLKDIDLESKLLKVTGKGGKERLLPILEELKDSISQYCQAKDVSSQNTYLFERPDGRKLYPKLVYRIVNDYIGKVSSLKKKSPHVLRHSFATHLLNRGAALNNIKNLLGHASLASTQIYTHNSIEKLKNIYKLAHPRA